MQKHNYSLDVLRFVASFMVVLFHLNQAVQPVDNWYRDLVKYGWLGVPMFFVISGYCIALSADHTDNARDFLVRRLLRIFPPYWISLAIVLVAACFQRYYTGANAVQGIPRNFEGVVAALTLTTEPFTVIPTMNWVYWTLTCELFFYLTVALVGVFPRRFRIYLLIGVSFASVFIGPPTGPLFFLAQWPAFGLGISVYYFFHYHSRLYYAVPLFLINITALFIKFGYSTYAVFTLATLSLIVLSHFFTSGPSFFSILGQHAYSVYLIHVPIGVYIMGVLAGRYKTQPLLNLLGDLVVYTFISVLAWLMYKWVEQPSILAGRKLTARTPAS
ncbi:acyltransferase family protein [Mucilaginibacter sp. HD30]